MDVGPRGGGSMPRGEPGSLVGVRRPLPFSVTLAVILFAAALAIIAATGSTARRSRCRCRLVSVTQTIEQDAAFDAID